MTVYDKKLRVQRLRQHSVMNFVLLAIVGLTVAGCGLVQASEDEIKQAWQTSAHADSESRAFTNWDRDSDGGKTPAIPRACAKCHSTTGYHDFLGLDATPAGEVNNAAPVGTTIECEACHNQVTDQKDSAVMPSGMELAGLGNTAHCLDCHQGRETAVSVSEATGGLDEDDVNEALSFLNIHNNPAGPIQHGTEARGGYEYEGQNYAGLYTHAAEYRTCIDCHSPHTLVVDVSQCRACHVEATGSEALRNIRVKKGDFDGDGDGGEGIAAEIETMQERLLLAMRLYAVRTRGLDKLEYQTRPPYFVDETGEEYATWTPRLLRAAYNYHYALVGQGGYAHNAPYILQLLYDSLDDLGANTSAMIRPATN